MMYQTTEIMAKPTNTTAASILVSCGTANTWRVHHRGSMAWSEEKDNSQFMLTSVTGKMVGKDKMGMARMNQAIDTLLCQLNPPDHTLMPGRQVRSP